MPEEKLPRNPIEAQGLLIKAFYARFGAAALPVIAEICGLQGKALGEKIKAKLPDQKLSTVASAFARSFDQDYVHIAELNDRRFQFQGTGCPFGLEGTDRNLCEAVMMIDREYFRAAVSPKMKLTVIKTRAGGDPFCDTLYELGED
ncbi:MAG: hypothetical protein PHY31_02500 [Smithellaceae bacterium]|nr:hypothetical protein [Smithellaceae bacterium]